ncbi:MAG TPA: ABC transporter permease subunit [Clostridia bacterium]|nr:ABC transporter permease subunit [Clostridia bacterium]
MLATSTQGARRWRNIRRHAQLYLLLLLPLLYLLLFRYAPMVGAQIAFRKYRVALGIWGSDWVGLENFRKFMGSYQFRRVISNTLILSVYSLAAGFPLPILLALALNTLRRQGIKRFLQTVTYLPYFISVVVVAGMVIQIFNVRTGLFGHAYGLLAGTTAPDLLASPAAFRHIYVFSGVWQGVGWNSIIYIAALASVDPEQHEAALLDGATRFQRVIHVDFPAILPTVVILLILQCGSLMSIGFEKAYLLQNSMNLRASEVIATYVYKVGLSATGNYSYGAAIDIFNAAINLSILTGVNWISRKVAGSSLW